MEETKKRPDPIPSGTKINFQGLVTTIIGAEWNETKQAWSYRINSNRSLDPRKVHFHILSTEPGIEVLNV